MSFHLLTSKRGDRDKPTPDPVRFGFALEVVMVTFPGFNQFPVIVNDAIYWHLKQIYQKHNISRQADLIRLVQSAAGLG